MDLDSLQPLLVWVRDNPNLSYLLIFLLSLAESLIVVGLIIPGITIMAIIGTLIGAGYISLWPSMIAAILGAILGDGLSYAIGRKFQQHIRNWRIFRRYPDIILKCEKFFARHGGKSVVFGRFAGPIRPMIPAIAGMMKMPPLQFYVVNIISALLWAPSHLLPGVIFGNALVNLPPGISKKIITVVICALTAIWLTSKIIKTLWHNLKRKVHRWGTRIWFYVENNSLTFLQKIIKHPLTHRKHQADSFLFLLLTFFVTIIFITLTKLHIIITVFNPFFKHLALILNTQSISNILLILDSNSSESILLLIFIGYFIYFAINSTFNKHKLNTTIFNHQIILNRHLYLSSGLLISFFLTTYIISHIVKYPTPYQLSYVYTNLYSTSFPNTSIGLLTLLLGYIAVIKYCNDPKQYQQSSYNIYAGLILTIFIGFKLYLGYVWLTDVIGAILISSCLLLIFCIFYWQKPIENINIKNFNLVSLSLISCIIVANTGVYYFQKNHDQYNINTVRQNLDTEQLLYQDWQHQQDLFIHVSDPIINIQWLGNIDTINALLRKQGWEEQPRFNFKTMLVFLENNPAMTSIPLLPTYYQDHAAVLVMSKLDQNNKIITIRLWQSEYTLAKDNINTQTLWVGTVEYFKPQKLFNFITILRHWPQREFSDAAHSFVNILNKIPEVKCKVITDSNQTLTDDNLKIMLVTFL